MNEIQLSEIFSEREIQNKITSLAGQIASDTQGEKITLIGLLDGCFMFIADLARALHKKNMTVEIGFISLSSYGDCMISSGDVKLNLDISFSIEKQDIIIVDDIVDTGFTLEYAINHLRNKKPASIKSAVLLDKKVRRKIEICPEYKGFLIEDFFVVGYGLDFAGKYRELPAIYKIESS